MIDVARATQRRLRTFGAADRSDEEILVALMDEVDRERFVAQLQRQADQVVDWVPLD